jgi:hypothetical protein
MPDTNQRTEASSTTPSSVTTNSTAASSVSRPKPTKTVNIVLQGKGGVGKTLVATLIAQYHLENGVLVACYDTDPVNATFAAFKGLDAKVVPILKGRVLNVEPIDKLMNDVIISAGSSVIDNGAASFVPFSDYLLKSGIPDLAQAKGCRVVIHVVLAGGPNINDTMKGFISILDAFPPSVSLVVWINEFFGPFEINGMALEQLPVFQKNKSRILGVVYLRQLDPELEGFSLRQMLARRLTFTEALTNEDLDIVTQSRLMAVRRNIFAQIPAV